MEFELLSKFIDHLNFKKEQEEMNHYFKRISSFTPTEIEIYNSNQQWLDERIAYYTMKLERIKHDKRTTELLLNTNIRS